MTRKNRPRSTESVTTRPLLFGFVGPTVILAAALLAIWPMLKAGPSCGADFQFHITSWLDAQHSLLSGLPYPHWANAPNYGAGEPRFIFYPPLTWMLGAVLGLFFSWTAVPITLVFLLLAGTGLAHRALARLFLSDGPATLAGCAAIFIGNLLVDVYMRSDYAELTGGIWIPLLLLFQLRTRTGAPHRLPRTLAGVAPLALIIAGIWLSNGPLGIMSTYLLFAIAAISAKTDRSWLPMIRASIALPFGLSLSAIYLIPAFWERKWADLSAAIAQREYIPQSGWLFHLHNDQSWSLYDTSLEIHSWLVIFMFGIIVIAASIAWKRSTMRTPRAAWIALALIPLAVLFMQLPVSYPVWQWLPGLRYLQFPWRWLIVMVSPLAVFFAAAFWAKPLRVRIPILAACAILFFFLSGGTWGVCSQNCSDLSTTLLLFDQGEGVRGKPEYAPPGVQHPVLDQNVPSNCEIDSLSGAPDLPQAPVENPAVHTSQTCQATFAETTSQPEHKVFVGTADQTGVLILRLRSYSAWQVRVNGVLKTPLAERNNGLIAVSIPRGPVTVTADWNTTPDVWVGRWISLFALALLAVMFVVERKASTARLS